MKKHITVSLTPCQAVRLLKCMQEHGEAPLIFKESGQKGGFWGALASTLLPVVASAAMPLVEKGVGALVKKKKIRRRTSSYHFTNQSSDADGETTW